MDVNLRSVSRRWRGVSVFILLLLTLVMALSAGATPGDQPAWQAPQLIKNILARTGDSFIGTTVEMNGRLYFSTFGHGLEQNIAQLWRTDGTPGGTILLEERNDTTFSTLLALGDKLIFHAPHPDYGEELWVSDGTRGNAEVMGDVFPPPFDGNVAYHTVAGDYIYFTAYDFENETELWRTDGTAAGTIRLTGPDLGLDVEGIFGLTGVDDTLFFFGLSPDNKSLLLKSNGTVATTTVVLETSEPNFGGATYAIDGLLYIVGLKIWRSDGTTAGTYAIHTFGDSQTSYENIIAAETRLYFFVLDPNSNQQLWQSKGTAATTTKIIDMPGYYGRLATSGDLLFFRRHTDELADEPWISDGTAAGTKLLKDINPGPIGSSIDYVIGSDSRFYFVASDEQGAQKLWRSDGTTGGTTLLTVPNGADDLQPLPIAPFGNELFFQIATLAHGREPWMTTGGGASAAFLVDLNQTDMLSSLPGAFNYVNDTLFFWTPDGGLWRSDGSEAGTSVLVPNVSQHRVVRSGSGEFGRVGNYLYFLIDDYPSSTVELWRSDGTTGGTSLIKAIAPMFSPEPVSQMVDVGGTLYFARFSKERPGKELWRSNGTAAGTVLVDTPNETFEESSEIAYITGLGQIALFAATDGTNGVELWRSDGTAAGTYMLKDIAVGKPSSAPSDLTAVGGHVYFLADNGSHGRELWRTDGTAAGTVLVKDVRPGAAASDAAELTHFDGHLYFIADDGTHGRELWRSDGTAAGTVMLKDIVQPDGSNPTELTAADDWLYFLAIDSQGQQPWKTDGTSAGTSRIATLQYPDFTVLEELTAVGNLLFFRGGSMLYQSDGTAEGTFAEAEAFPAFQVSELSGLTAAPDRLFFGANHLLHGYEPFVKNLRLLRPTPARLMLPLNGSAQTYALVLAGKPAANATIALTTDHPLLEISPATLTFTPNNWSKPQTVTVKLKSDTLGNAPLTGQIEHTVSSADADVDGITETMPFAIDEWWMAFVPVVMR